MQHGLTIWKPAYLEVDLFVSGKNAPFHGTAKNSGTSRYHQQKQSSMHYPTGCKRTFGSNFKLKNYGMKN
jgi:hypothetical protein